MSTKETITSEELESSLDKMPEVFTPIICTSIEDLLTKGLEPLPGNLELLEHKTLQVSDNTKSYLTNLLEQHFVQYPAQANYLQLLNDPELSVETRIRLLFSLTQAIIRSGTTIPRNPEDEARANYKYVEEAIGTGKPVTKCTAFNDLFKHVFYALCDFANQQEVAKYVRIFALPSIGVPVDIHYQQQRSFPHGYLGVAFKSDGQMYAATIDPYWGDANSETPDKIIPTIDYSSYRAPVAGDELISAQIESKLKTMNGGYHFAAVAALNYLRSQIEDLNLPLSSRLQFAARLAYMVKTLDWQYNVIVNTLTSRREDIERRKQTRAEDLQRLKNFTGNLRDKWRINTEVLITLEEYLPTDSDMQLFADSLENTEAILVKVLQEAAAAPQLNAQNLLEVMNLYNEIVFRYLGADLAAADKAVNQCLDQLFTNLNIGETLTFIDSTPHLHKALNRRIFIESIGSALHNNPKEFSYTNAGLSVYFKARARLVLWWAIVNPQGLHLLSETLGQEAQQPELANYFKLYTESLKSVIDEYSRTLSQPLPEEVLALTKIVEKQAADIGPQPLSQ